MKFLRRAIVVLCAVTAIAPWGRATAAPNDDFTRANADYAAGHHNEAIQQYEKLVATGTWTANLFYNLANAYFRNGDPGRAILNYERALTFDRHHPESRANLEIVRDQTHALELASTRLNEVTQFATANQYATTAAVAFWLAAFVAIRWIFSKTRRRGAVVLCIIFLAVSGLSIFLTRLRSTDDDARAIVVAANVQARLATADNANTVLSLPAGSEIKVLSQRGNWIYADLPNNLRGWIPAKDAEKVRL